uniref:Bm14140 n=1 Tax=Brugia malayi TaxID=6279 RepID=A0A1I9G0G9_BRUMA|nr:Bm14140 [Brugia malayi]
MKLSCSESVSSDQCLETPACGIRSTTFKMETSKQQKV